MLTQAELKAELSYNQKTGIFKWRKNKKVGRTRKNTIAGSEGKSGRVIIKVFYVNYCAADLAWLYVTGEWPASRVHHANKDRSNTKIKNLYVIKPATRITAESALLRHPYL